MVNDQKVKMEEVKPLIDMVQIDLLKDSLDDGILESHGFESDLAKKVRLGHMPEEMLCKDSKTGQTIQVEFDHALSRCYFNQENKLYYKPANL